MNHARTRAREVVAQLRRQRPVAPHGDPGLNDLETMAYAVGRRAAIDHSCPRCGYLKCNCPPPVPAKFPDQTFFGVDRSDGADEHEHALLRGAGWVLEPMPGFTSERWRCGGTGSILRKHDDGWYVYRKDGNGISHSKQPTRRSAMRALGFVFAGDDVLIHGFRVGDKVRIGPSATQVGVEAHDVGGVTTVRSVRPNGDLEIYKPGPCGEAGDVWIARQVDLERVSS